ncbi:nickel-dependent hydrogenase large subunit [Escherichia coli]
MKLPPEVNLIAVAHYLQALECQRDANRVVGRCWAVTRHTFRTWQWVVSRTQSTSTGWACSEPSSA